MLPARPGYRVPAVSGGDAARQGVRAGDGGNGHGGPLHRFVVTVGTDHHPFDRLIGWVNDWLARHPDQVGAFFVQSGSASVAPAAASAKFLDDAGLRQVLDEADVMICHGGPGSIADAWQRGQVPIVVPRLRRFREAVDDHQVDFCRMLGGHGRVRVAEDAATFGTLVGEAAADRAGFLLGDVVADGDAAVEHAVARFDALVNDLISEPRRRLPLIARGARRPRHVVNAGTGFGAAANEQTGDEQTGPDPVDGSLGSRGRTSGVRAAPSIARGEKQ